ncbi:hypothetical protein JOB18_024639 [Solea senegalensis]|uniref:Coiled-coil-helix-coiled-coil-helix domain containing 6b n=1 Tax=Solea senegalensis TaxID=28829 RepID=A0AAV6QM07_SOLSE|nr:MICOS complex subunit mic25a-like isoform X1 [Solea senegalensis]KAG7494168.1 hypothetical protein JOB18_024639 [Solea senegalensis]
MGAHESTARRVSFGLDEDMKVTVIEGVKLSEDVLRWMREHRRSDSEKSSTSPTDGNKPPESPKPTGASATEIQKELRKDFERQQAFVKESLSRLAQKERETAATTGLDELIVERGKVHEEQEKAKLLPADLDAWAKQLQSKEMELASISSFYKEQIEVLEKKNFDIYKESAEQYNQAATKAEARISPHQAASVCTELQAKVLQCFRENPQQTLHCSSLAKQYMTCVQQAKKSLLTNHG